jgi:hypothetical protein
LSLEAFETGIGATRTATESSGGHMITARLEYRSSTPEPLQEDPQAWKLWLAPPNKIRTEFLAHGREMARSWSTGPPGGGFRPSTEHYKRRRLVNDWILTRLPALRRCAFGLRAGSEGGRRDTDGRASCAPSAKGSPRLALTTAPNALV